MRTMRLSLVAITTLALLCWPGAATLAQDAVQTEDEATIEVVWELPVPSRALPDDFVKLVVEDWTIAAGTDTTESPASVLGNEALRGRGLVIESGALDITPATEALLWRGATGEAESSPAGTAVTLAAGDAVFLPATPDDSVDREAPIVFHNQGDEPVTARSFHAHQNGGTFYGFPTGLSLGDWDMAGSFDPDTRAALSDVDVVFRLTRITGQPGALVPIAITPAFGLYFVEDGALELVSSGKGGEFVFEWPTGRNGFLTRAEGVEQTLHVMGDRPATVLEFAVIPQPGSDG